MINERYNVKLENVFEGPMDLLIFLIKKAEVDIYDIPIALITDQYLEYIEWMKSMNIDFAGEFLVMAATLTHIKSRMLLPLPEDEEDSEDPRLEITRPLLEYLQLKEVADQLARRNLLGEISFTRASCPKDSLGHDDEQVIEVGLFELIEAFQKVLDSISPEHKVDLTTDRITVKDRISEIVDQLEIHGSMSLPELFAGKTDRGNIVVTFLAILEMVKLSLVRVAQYTQNGVIRIFYL